VGFPSRFGSLLYVVGSVGFLPDVYAWSDQVGIQVYDMPISAAPYLKPWVWDAVSRGLTAETVHPQDDARGWRESVANHEWVSAGFHLGELLYWQGNFNRQL
jgi:hypothetical protein